MYILEHRDMVIYNSHRCTHTHIIWHWYVISCIFGGWWWTDRKPKYHNKTNTRRYSYL